LVWRPRVASLLGAALALTFVAQLLVRPMIDPRKNMRPGVLELAASIPAGEELVGYDLDETTLAVVPFYSGRLLRDLRTAGDPVLRPRHLVVLEKRRERLPAQRQRPSHSGA